MGPELLSPDQFNFKDSRPTKESDCYAFGMVIYEVLSGQAPFTPYKDAIVMRKILDGEHPERPGGAQGALFVDSLWGTLSLCWATEPNSRPDLGSVFKTLEQVSGTWVPTPPHEGVADDRSDWNLSILSVRFFVMLCGSVEDAVLIKSPQKLDSTVDSTELTVRKAPTSAKAHDHNLPLPYDRKSLNDSRWNNTDGPPESRHEGPEDKSRRMSGSDGGSTSTVPSQVAG